MSLEKYIREVVQYCQKNNLDLDNVLEYFRQVWCQEFAKGKLSSTQEFPEQENEKWITCSGCGRNGPLSYVGSVRPAPKQS